MSEKAAASSRTPARRRISRTVENVKRLFVKADTMPSLAMVLSGDTCYPIRLVLLYYIISVYTSVLVDYVYQFGTRSTRCSAEEAPVPMMVDDG